MTVEGGFTMKRTLLTTIASSLLAFAAPAVASAAHGKHHHGARHSSAHKRHAKRARLVTFTPATAPTTAPGTPSTPPATPSTETAATVTSFTNGVLTITLTDGSVVSGKVTEETELRCQSATPPSGTEGDDQGGGDDQNGSESGEHGGPSPAGIVSRDFQGNNGHGGGDDEGDESCTTAALVPGAKIGEAELSVSSAGAVWEKLELIS
jgi:hypothetical protein